MLPWKYICCCKYFRIRIIESSGNVVAALDVDGNGTFASGDIVLDVADNITSAQYNYNSDTFQFFV